MARRCCLLLMIALLVSCQKAQQYPANSKVTQVKTDEKPADADAVSHRLGWLESKETYDTPILFVAPGAEEWSKLKDGWNAPPFPAGWPTIHLGLPPLTLVAAWVLAEPISVIKIKVPLGLPDPTPNLPRTNPPTLAKWRLGKALFFMPIVTAGAKNYSCATCHDPRHGFAADPNNPPGAKFNTPSLVNAVYNRRQFWDGRVQTLEETMFNNIDDERRASPEKRLEKGLEQHIWGGFVRDLLQEQDKSLLLQLQRAFGIEQPTQHAVAQALATYVRTILAGDSVYDRADQVRRAQNAKALTAAHFAAVLKNEGTAAPLRDHLAGDQPKRAEMPALLAKGVEVFFGNGRCGQCHSGSLFTDHDFHNIGLGTDENWPSGGTKTGRAAHVPVGLMQARLRGAFKTPSVRNLVSTNPYFHDGSQRSLRDVVEFFDHGVLPAPHLAKVLSTPRHLQLTQEEQDGLVMVLRALQGTPVDAMVLAP